MNKILQGLSFLILTPVWMVIGVGLVTLFILCNAIEIFRSLFEFSLSGKWNYTVQKIW